MTRISEVLTGFPRVAQADPNAMAEWLIEVPMLTEDFRETHRFQIIGYKDTMRNEFVLHVTDLGSTVQHPGPPLRMPILGAHSVDEAKDMAIEARTRGTEHTLEVLAQKQTDSTLLADAADKAEVEQLVAQNTSRFGPGQIAGTQRNAFPTLKDNKSKFGRR